MAIGAPTMIDVHLQYVLEEPLSDLCQWTYLLCNCLYVGLDFPAAGGKSFLVLGLGEYGAGVAYRGRVKDKSLLIITL